jgi:uncharacterized membrane protein
MHALDFISILLSFVYAAAVTHLLATAGDIAIALKRVNFSWLNSGWMIVSLLTVAAWWIGLWDLRGKDVWSMGVLGLFFGVACLMYLQVRLVCPRIATDGPVDLDAFHRNESRKYIGAYFFICLVAIGVNTFFTGGNPIWETQNYAMTPMALASLAAIALPTVGWVQIAAIVVQLAMWGWYFAALQPPLIG